MKEYSIPMAVFDLLPVVFFIAGTMTIAGDMKQKMTLPAKILFVGGSRIVCAAGLLKALYKLVFSMGVGDPAWMSGQFFYNQAFGFLLAGVGLTLAVTRLDKAQGGGLVPAARARIPMAQVPAVQDRARANSTQLCRFRSWPLWE
ncbi:MAG: hypothetical protein J6E40_09710 [Lachnospiraceae bacterium]|nr:hypothetical protein [Lachnospiraceae bacterium]